MTTSEKPNVVLVFDDGTMLPCLHPDGVDGLRNDIEFEFSRGRLFIVVQGRAKIGGGGNTRPTAIAVRIDNIFTIVEMEITTEVGVDMPAAFSSRKDMN